jgi:hypothetical protein
MGMPDSFPLVFAGEKAVASAVLTWMSGFGAGCAIVCQPDAVLVFFSCGRFAGRFSGIEWAVMGTWKSPVSTTAVLALVWYAATGCVSSAPGPEPETPMPRVVHDDEPLAEFGVNIRLTLAVERYALHRIPLQKSVDAQIRAMVAHVKEHGRGELEEKRFDLTDEVVIGNRDRHQVNRLGWAALQLMPYLDLDSGPAELSRVALAALHEKLGEDAEYMEAVSGVALAGGGLGFEMRKGVGYLSIRLLDPSTGDRALAVLDQWAASESLPRAIILDLSGCEAGRPGTAAAIANALAPGKKSLELLMRNHKSGKMEKREWRAEAVGRGSVYERVPLFVVTSARTGGLGEAVAHALRHHRTARVIGAVTSARGRVMAWHDLPWDARWGFAVAEVIGADGKPRRPQPVIPDICNGDAGLTALSERTLLRYREQCRDTAEPVRGDVVIDHVIALLDEAKAEAAEAENAGD